MSEKYSQFPVLVILLVGLMVSSLGCGGGSSAMSAPPPPQFGFATPYSFSTGGLHSGSLVVADFNRDGKPDIAVSNYMSNSVSVFLNQGGGKFGVPILNPVQVSISLGAMVSGDFNEDGKPDLLISAVAGN